MKKPPPSEPVPAAPAVPIAPPRGPLFPLAQMLMSIGAAVFAAALLGAAAGREPFHTWFYSFAWWSLLLFMDGFVYRRRGESLLLNHPARFAFFAFFSVGLWFLFEAINLRLHNWSYQGLPSDTLPRWAGYVLAFATVVPAVMETADLLDASTLLHDQHVKPLGWKKSLTTPLVSAGAGLLLLALLWPSLFFPFVWGAIVLLIDPLNERLGAPSLLTDWREGNVRRLKTLLLAGLLCGVLWEGLNMVAGARWVYHLPGLDRVKLFEMPLPGYLGFPLFAAEVFVLSAFALAAWERASAPVKVALAAGWAGFVFLMCGAVDKITAGL